MAKSLIILCSSFYPRDLVSQPEIFESRICDYIKGFKKFFSIIDKSKTSFDFLHVDNTVNSATEIRHQSLVTLLDNFNFIKRFYFIDNVWGAGNKGCGLIDAIDRVFKSFNCQDYEYIIYFEPRQLLIDGYFFERFLNSPGNYFFVQKFPVRHIKGFFIFNRLLASLPPLFYTQQFWTGLFSIEPKSLISYVNRADKLTMLKNKICIERDLFKFMKPNQYRKIDKLNLLRHEISSNQFHKF